MCSRLVNITCKIYSNVEEGFKNEAGKATKCKFSYIPITLPIIPDKKLTLVVIRGFGKLPMMLITNINPTDKRLSLAILKH